MEGEEKGIRHSASHFPNKFAGKTDGFILNRHARIDILFYLALI